MRSNVTRLSPDAIAEQIPSGATVALTGSGVFLEADEIFAAIERRFLAQGRPRGLTLVHALGIGDGRGSGLDRFAHEGLVARVIGGHWSWGPRMQALAAENRVAAYSFPAGVISTLLRESGAGRPGVITRIGLGTFADPRLDAGRCNAAALETLVELMLIEGREYLRYKPLKIDIALVRATEADPYGNLSCRCEPADLDIYPVALAAHNSGGQVFAQVEAVIDTRIVPSRLVRVPGVLVDAVVAAPEARGTWLPGYDPHIAGAVTALDVPPELVLPQGLRRIIAERALKELSGVRSVNFGFGIPGGVPALAARAGVSYWGTIEQGIHNGTMIDGPMFGAARDPDAIVASIDQFDFYAGGGIDAAFLGMGEMDGHGNVNVSHLGGRLIGPGGFIDITQTARKVVFCGAFEARGLKVSMVDGALSIDTPGAAPKLVSAVDHITFSGSQARANGQTVLYVTERAVFRLEEDEIALIELAPGVDLQTDVLDRMGFAPRVALTP